MNLADFRANGGFSQRSLSIFGNPKAAREGGNLGMAMLFERFLLEAKSASSAATENAKDLWRPPLISRGKTDPERENRQIHYYILP